MAATYRTSTVGGGSSGTSNRSGGAITPVVGDLLVVFCNVTGNTNAAPTCSDGNTGGTYTLVGCVDHNGSTTGDKFSVFVRDALVPNTTSTTVTVATGSNTAGEVITVAVAGMTNVGAAAIRQSIFQASQAASSTPAPSFAAAALTGNMTLSAVGNATAASITPNASWTERQEANQTSPVANVEVNTRDSGFTGQTITYGGTSATGFASVALELDGSVPVTGVSATGTVGAIVMALTIALTGVSGTGSVGTVTPDTPTTVALTGVSATGSVGSAAILRSDNFNRADSASSLGTPSDAGAAWTVSGGTWGIATNQGYRVDNILAFGVAWLDAGSPNARVKITLPTLPPYRGMVARLSDGFNFLFYLPAIGSSGGGIWKREANSDTHLATFDTTPANGDTYELAVDANNLITAYQNGVFKGSVTDSFNATATGFGVYVIDTVGTGRFDDFSITALGLVPGITAALTGASATAAVGTMAADTTVALTGNAATGSVGAVTPPTAVARLYWSRLQGAVPPGGTVAISGVSGTGSVGSVAPSTSVVITGNAGTGAVGTVIPAVTVALTGNAATGNPGSVTAEIAPALTGNAVTGAVGTVSPSLDVALSGNSGTGTVGTISASAPGSASITGVVGTTSVGTVAPGTSVALTGNAATGAVGSVTASLSVAVSGNAGVGSVGTVLGSGSSSIAITGNAATGSVGSVSPITSLALSGNAGTGSVGSVTAAIAVALNGNVATGSVGSVVPPSNGAATLTGNAATGHVGNVAVGTEEFGGPTKDWMIARRGTEWVIDKKPPTYLETKRDTEWVIAKKPAKWLTPKRDTDLS